MTDFLDLAVELQQDILYKAIIGFGANDWVWILTSDNPKIRQAKVMMANRTTKKTYQSIMKAHPHVAFQMKHIVDDHLDAVDERLIPLEKQFYEDMSVFNAWTPVLPDWREVENDAHAEEQIFGAWDRIEELRVQMEMLVATRACLSS